jgi:SAM-dependent methyltransferase
MRNVIYIIKALLRRGPGFIFLYMKESLAFDLINGTNTHLRVPKAEQSESNTERRDGLLYVASLTSVIRRTLAEAKGILGEKDFGRAQFLDLGCGKGKTLLVYAMDYAGVIKKKAVGIEYESLLCETARKNVAKIKPAAEWVEIACDSAVNVDAYVRSDILVIYLYNSFQGETLRAVLSKLAKYRHVLIYVDPVERRILSEYGYEIRAFHQGRHNANTWLVAHHVPATEAARR